MPMAASMSHMVAFADVIPILSTLSAKSLRHKAQLPVENRLASRDFDPSSEKIRVMSMTVSKDLEPPGGDSVYTGVSVGGEAKLN